jgi:hypothetical protein
MNMSPHRRKWILNVKQCFLDCPKMLGRPLFWWQWKMRHQLLDRIVLFSFGEEKLVAPLIATPNVDNANRRQKKGKKLNYKLRVILMQKGIVFVFANYLDDVLVWNYDMSGFKRRMEIAGTGFVPACFHVLNSLKFRL